MKVSSEWFRHLPEDEQKEFIEQVIASRRVLARLTALLNEKEANLDRGEASKETYENAGYPFWQAHVNGRRAELKELRQLLAFLDPKGN
jgi:hypothetical protein